MKSKLKYGYDIEKRSELDCYVIDLPIYKCRVKILNPKNSAKLEKDFGYTDDNWGMKTRDYLAKDGSIVISVLEYSLDDMIHELYHAVTYIMAFIGHEINKDTDEPAAYLMGYLTKEFLKIEKYFKAPNH